MSTRTGRAIPRAPAMPTLGTWALPLAAFAWLQTRTQFFAVPSPPRLRRNAGGGEAKGRALVARRPRPK
eukprot:4930545-Alexandrium_andersonii.AAC.1